MSSVFENLQLQRIADGLTGGAMQFNLGVTVPGLIGATAGDDGAAGLVPQPMAGDEGKFLSGAGTWEDAGGGGGADIVINGFVETGDTFDGLPIKCLCLAWNNFAFGTTQSAVNLSGWGFSDTMNGFLKIEGFAYSGDFRIPIDCSNCYINISAKQITINASIAPLWTWSVSTPAYFFIYYY